MIIDLSGFFLIYQVPEVFYDVEKSAKFLLWRLERGLELCSVQWEAAPGRKYHLFIPHPLSLQATRFLAASVRCRSPTDGNVHWCLNLKTKHMIVIITGVSTLISPRLRGSAAVKSYEHCSRNQLVCSRCHCLTRSGSVVASPAADAR